MCALHKSAVLLFGCFYRSQTYAILSFIFHINIEIMVFVMLSDLPLYYSYILGYLDLFGYSFYLYCISAFNEMNRKTFLCSGRPPESSNINFFLGLYDYRQVSVGIHFPISMFKLTNTRISSTANELKPFWLRYLFRLIRLEDHLIFGIYIIFEVIFIDARCLIVF